MISRALCSIPPTLLLAAGLALPAAAQTEVLHSIERPPGFGSDWGFSFGVLHDLDGDGVPDLAIGTHKHGGGLAASIHSGADGSHLFDLVTPGMLLFVGHAIVSVAPPAGQSTPELVVLGSRSGAAGSPNGWIGVFSGADGRLVREFVPPPEMSLFELAPALVLGDVNGDGHDDFLCKVRLDVNGDGWHTEHALQLFSSGSGEPIYPDPLESDGRFPGERPVRVSDHDGDGHADLAVPVREPQGPFSTLVTTAIEIRSAASGATLAILEPPGVETFTNNGEPLIVTEDADGDGLADLALGSVFSGLVVHFSSADGAPLQQWSCADEPELPCLGARLIEAGDLNGDGHADLIALESFPAEGDTPRLFGLDPLSGAVLFEQTIPGLASVYSNKQRLIALPMDPLGFPTFALLEELEERVTLRRFAPEAGTKTCASTPNLTGEPATIRALGYPEVSVNHFGLELEQATPRQLGLFVHGPLSVQLPFGSGFQCAGGSLVRLPAGLIDGHGRMSLGLDLVEHGLLPGTTRTFQAYFREPTPVGFQTSDGVRVEFVP